MERQHLGDLVVPGPMRASLPPCTVAAPRVAIIAFPPGDDQLEAALADVSHSHCHLGVYVAPNAFVVDCEEDRAIKAALALVELGAADRLICLPARRTIDSEIGDGRVQRRFQPLNKFSRYVTQAGSRRDLPMFRNGLNGTGQVVAIADTGVDHDMCYFHDPNHEVPINKVNMDHRKIVVYRVLPEGWDQSPDTSHGTHTAGSLAGQAWSTDPSLTRSMSILNGMSFAAKLAVYDLGPKQTMRIPGNLYTELFEVIEADSGAKISSNSWGAPLEQDEENTYDQYALAVDKYVWDHPDFLIVFGAGNWGSSTSAATIGTPAIAKNALTVGSATSTAQSFKEAHLVPHVFMKVLQPSDRNHVTGYHSMIQAKIGGDVIELAPVPRDAVLATPSDACSPLHNNYSNQFVFVFEAEGACSVATQALHVQSALGVGMLVVTGGPGTSPIDESPGSSSGRSLATSITIPIIGVEHDLAMDLIKMGRPRLLIPAYDDSLKEKRSLGFVSDFSSRGPTYDGRIKPDILSPGEYILSAKSDRDLTTFQCDPSQYSSMKGTSMSTPIAAGNMVQIRQYLVDGYYPTGKPNQQDSISSPTAALLKALAINSGVAMHGWVRSASADAINAELVVDPVGAIPSHVQGFGRMQLDQVLPFAVDGADPSSFQLSLVENRTIQTHQHHHYCFRADTAARPFKATLVWSDPPADLDADYLLINDIDLVATSINSSLHWVGNGRDPTPTTNASLHQLMDHENNVEQISITQSNEDFIDVLVIGTNIRQSPQPYALVVTGSFSSHPLSSCHGAASLCPNSCSYQGRCSSEGLCLCNPGYTGFDCAYTSEPILSLHTNVVGSVPVGRWSFFHFDVIDQAPGDGASSMRVGSQTRCLSVRLVHGGGVQAHPQLFVSAGRMPGLGQAQWVNQTRGGSDGAITITIRGSPYLLSDRYYIGVLGGCCKTADFSLSFSDECSRDFNRSASQLELADPVIVSTSWMLVVALFTISSVVIVVVLVVRILSGVPDRYRRLDKADPASMSTGTAAMSPSP